VKRRTRQIRSESGCNGSPDYSVVTDSVASIGLSATDASLPRRCQFDEHALGLDASLSVGVDDLVGPRDRCCDVKGQVPSTSVDT
jgi:hypothetical protein